MTDVRLVPEQVGRVKLSKTQLRVLKSIEEGEEVTASQIAKRCELSPSWASNILKGIYDKAYLNRKVHSKKSGGLVYSYMTTF